MIDVGARYGALTVTAFIKGAKNRHSLVACKCDCGGLRKVRSWKLENGVAFCCSRCSHKQGWQHRHRLDSKEADLRNKEGIYRINARRKQIPWRLSRDQFRSLILADCTYCGAHPSGGIDRIVNTLGYLPGNVCPCCATCNYAKRKMEPAEFIAWIKKAHDHISASGILQRHGSILLRVDEQPNGRGIDHARNDLRQINRRFDAGSA